MRILLTILMMFVLIPGSFSQNNKGAFIAFDRELHEFGKVSVDSIPDGKVKFMIYNQGDQPLVLSNVRACCGTKVNDYTKHPIAPKGSGFVEVEFRIVPQPHRISRTVTIQSNSANRQTAILRIVGEVVESGGDLTLQK
jgi:hypothetical protein